MKLNRDGSMTFVFPEEGQQQEAGHQQPDRHSVLQAAQQADHHQDAGPQKHQVGVDLDPEAAAAVAAATAAAAAATAAAAAAAVVDVVGGAAHTIATETPATLSPAEGASAAAGDASHTLEPEDAVGHHSAGLVAAASPSSSSSTALALPSDLVPVTFVVPSYVTR
jgi:hypothetical protein